jgi:hypothetical protein
LLGHEEMVWKLINHMMDLMVVYIAASLARYSTPAWAQIIEANRDDIYNDIRAAYHSVFSHWILDFLVHRSDLPLYDDTAKVGLGLWNWPAVAFSLEAALLFGGMAVFSQRRAGPKAGLILFGLVMLGIQAIVFFGPPPASDTAAAITALLAYGLFAGFVARWEARHTATSRGAA